MCEDQANEEAVRFYWTRDLCRLGPIADDVQESLEFGGSDDITYSTM